MEISAILLLVSSSILGQVQETKKDVFFSANRMNFNLDQCYIKQLDKPAEPTDIRIKHNCKTLLNIESSMECKVTYIQDGKIIQQPSFKPVWKKEHRKLVDIQSDSTRIIAWDEKGNVVEKVLLENSKDIAKSEERTCKGRAF